MSKQDLAAYEKLVEKAVAGCINDIGKEVKGCHDAVIKRVSSVVKEIRGIKISQGMDEKDLKQIPDLIQESVKKNNAKLKDGLVQLDLSGISVDVKEKEVWIAAFGINGKLASL